MLATPGPTMLHRCFLATIFFFTCVFQADLLWMSNLSWGQEPPDSSNPKKNPGIELTRRTLSARVAAIEQANDLRQFRSIDAWTTAREALRVQLKEMLGLPPLESRGMDLNPVITGTLETDSIRVEKLYFESSPGLFVTANLYRPKQVDKPLPAVLVVCGHGQVKENGISLGNKTHYQHHPAWLADHGYVAMAIDTIQLGEIEGIHHGLYRMKRWDWPARGYTPAGVETWNAIRAVDYLAGRSEVDPTRIGITGRSGGGAYSWFAAAVDPRIAAAVPVAGITDLRDHVLDQVVRGHCDCMFFCNRYGWDYSTLAALVHPRALLIGNTDEDPIFPLDGVFRVQQQVHAVYQLQSKSNLGIHWSSGGHEDTQELQLGCFVWLDKHLQGGRRRLEEAAQPRFEKSQLRVFESLPQNQKVTDVQDWFVPVATPNRPASEKEWKDRSQAICNELAKIVHGRLPSFASTVDHQGDNTKKTAGTSAQSLVTNNARDPDGGRNEKLKVTAELSQDGWDIRLMECPVEPASQAVLLRFESEVGANRGADPSDTSGANSKETKGKDSSGKPITMIVASQSRFDAWQTIAPRIQPTSGSAIGDSGSPPGSTIEESWKVLLEGVDRKGVTYLVFPEGSGPAYWDRSDPVGLHWRRSYLLVGWSLEGRQVAGIAQAIERVLERESMDACRLVADDGMSAHALHAALLESKFISELRLGQLNPNSYYEGFTLMGILRFTDLGEVLASVSSTIPTTLANPEDFEKHTVVEQVQRYHDRALLRSSR